MSSLSLGLSIGIADRVVVKLLNPRKQCLLICWLSFGSLIPSALRVMDTRILANRQSAARSKERKARYIVELEKKVQDLEKEARTLSTKFAVYQRDVTNLAAANAELNLQLREMEQQIQLRIDLNESLKREAERLRVAMGERMGAQQHMTSVAYLQIPQSPQVGPHNNVYKMTMPTQHLHPPITHQSNSEYLQNGPSTICCLQEGIDIYGIEQLLKFETPPTCASESNSTIIAAEF